MTGSSGLTPQEARAREELRAEGFFRRDETTARALERMKREVQAVEAAVDDAVAGAAGAA